MRLAVIAVSLLLTGCASGAARTGTQRSTPVDFLEVRVAGASRAATARLAAAFRAESLGLDSVYIGGVVSDSLIERSLGVSMAAVFNGWVEESTKDSSTIRLAAQVRTTTGSVQRLKSNSLLGFGRHWRRLERIERRLATDASTPDLSLVPAASESSHPYGLEISSKYDRFENLTLVTLNLGTGDPDQVRSDPIAFLRLPDFSLSYAYPGTDKRTPSFITLAFSSSQRSWVYLDSHDVTILVDDSLRFQPDSRHDGKVGGGGYVYENVFATLPIGEAVRLADAQKVEVRVGPREFRLGPNQRAALREFLRRATTVP